MEENVLLGVEYFLIWSFVKFVSIYKKINFVADLQIIMLI